MTRWSRHAVIVLLVASMVMAAVPAQVGAASGTLVVGSLHTTEQDFQDGEVTNMSVIGSGDAASLQLSDNTTSRDSDTSDASTSDKAGLKIEPDEPVSEFTITLSSLTSGATTAYVETTSGTVLDTASISNGQATLSANLSAGTSYYVFVDAGGSTWTVGQDSSPSFPYVGGVVDITSGVTSSGEFDNGYAIKSISVSEIQSGKYVSETHNVSNPSNAAINITQASNVSVNATVRTDGGTVLNQTTLTSTGNHSLTLASTSSEKLETELNVSVTGDNPQFELADESILFTNDAPVVNNSTASPSGGEELSTDDVTLSIDVSDPQFGSAQGDELTVEWYIDGSKVDTTTGVTSNGTVSTTVEDVGGGERNWSAKVTDDYGATTTSQTFDFKIPNELAIRNVSAPPTFVTGANIKLTFYSDNEVVTRNDSDNDGLIDLSGLDPSERFIVVVEADNYYKRTVILDDIFTQDSVYLLNKSKAANEVRFTIDDPTGLFSSGEAEIFVKKALTRDFDNDSVDETQVVRIAGDEQGVNGFTTYLEESARYRIEVRNKDGDTRLLGAYTADTSETVTLQPGSLGLEFDNESTWNSTAYRRNVSGQPELVFEFADPANETTNLEVAIWEQGNKSHQPDNWTNVTVAGPLGSYQATPTLTANETDTVWVVNFTADRGGGKITGQFVLGPEIQQQLGGVAPWLLEALAMVAIILTGALFSKANAGVGGVTTALMGGGFWYVGFLSPEAGGGILLFLAIAIAYKFKGDMA